MTWKATDKLELGCLIWQRSNAKMQKKLAKRAEELIQLTKEGQGLLYECHKEYRCCFKVKYNLKTPVTIYFYDFPVIPPKNMFTQCFVSGTISANVDFMGEIGQCYKK